MVIHTYIHTNTMPLILSSSVTTHLLEYIRRYNILSLDGYIFYKLESLSTLSLLLVSFTKEMRISTSQLARPLTLLMEDSNYQGKSYNYILLSSVPSLRKSTAYKPSFGGIPVSMQRLLCEYPYFSFRVPGG